MLKWRLYQRMIVILWIHLKSLQIYCSWFEQTSRIRCCPKEIRQIEFAEQLQNVDVVNADGT